MKTVTCFVLSAVMTLAASTRAYSAPPDNISVAVISKVILDVRKLIEGRDWEKANRGETLRSGNRLRTGEKSIAIVKFLDNSMVRVRENSELTITGEKAGGAFSKSVDLQKGVIGFNIKKQLENEEFRFTSPTSVASIRGTNGIYNSTNANDTLTVTDGAVRLLNKISQRYVDVEAGFTGFAWPNGDIQKRPATIEEQRAAELLSRLGEEDNRLEFELRDGQGNRKQLRIEYK